MVVNKTTKKLKPLFPLPAGLTKKNITLNATQTLRIYNSQSKREFEEDSIKRNEFLLSKL
jgi:hypothetical protein